MDDTYGLTGHDIGPDIDEPEPRSPRTASPCLRSVSTR